jgi:methylisocitrate lyase
LPPAIIPRINMTITITVEKDGYYEVNGNRQEPTVNLYVIPAASKLQRMLKDTKDLIVCPGVYDGLSARIAMDLGFKGLYMVRTRLESSSQDRKY